MNLPVATYAICNLLPASTMGPFALGTKAGLSHTQIPFHVGDHAQRSLVLRIRVCQERLVDNRQLRYQRLLTDFRIDIFLLMFSI
jgi:hypothetical protein